MTSTDTARSIIHDEHAMEASHIVIEGTFGLLHKQIRKLEEENKMLLHREDEIKKLRIELAEQREKTETLESELDFSKCELQRAQSNNNILDVKILGLNEQVNNLNQENASLKRHDLEISTQLHAEREENRNLKIELRQEQDNAANAKKRVVEIAAELRVLEYRHKANIAKLEQEHADQINKSMEEVTDLTCKLAESKDETAKLRKVVEVQRLQIEEQNSFSENLMGQIEDLDYEIAELKNNEEGLHKTISNLSVRVNELTGDKERSKVLVKKLKETLLNAEDITDQLSGSKYSNN